MSTDFRILTGIIFLYIYSDIFKHWSEQCSITSLLPYITIKASEKKTWKTPNVNENVEQQDFSLQECIPSHIGIHFHTLMSSKSFSMTQQFSYACIFQLDENAYSHRLIHVYGGFIQTCKDRTYQKHTWLSKMESSKNILDEVTS